ncbi:adenosylcobinamide-phosphate synthase [Propionibacterium cyclohexanicum]|uniref:Cobalamin biosynthesis protein CobD n=2 Tax=Propionibacterium cyclohexanicum TaxID=64702 RepID=A0A1H9U0P4_9ACTN|nr:adenosylcobinamide-phosphate synthase [Propionibacterium cyclohexanicum]
MWADSRARGVLFTAVALTPLAALGAGLEMLTRRHPLAHLTATAVAGWVVLGAGSLEREGAAMAGHLERGELPAARTRLGHLCGRLAEDLDEPELARAAVESMAENTADSAIASLWWGSIAGIPGLLVHRGANTLDAMVGHRNARYAHFGTASARLDDLLDLAPARLTAALAALVSPVVHGHPGQVARIVARDAHAHPSPNGGWCEAAWAGALGVQLGGHNVYPGGIAEDRGLLGDGPRPRAGELRRAARLVRWVTLAAAALALGAGALTARSGR